MPAVFGGTPTGNTDAPDPVVPKPPVTDVSGGYVFNPSDFGGLSAYGIIGGQMQAAQVATPTQWNVTAPQTVQGQIKDIINPNSPIMQPWPTQFEHGNYCG